MKLKNFTLEETNQILEDLEQYWKLCAAVTEIAETNVSVAYNEHIKNYKWSWKRPFTKKVKSISEITYKICGGQFRDVNNEFARSKGFTRKLSCWFGDSDPRFLFSEKRKNDNVEFANEVGLYFDHNALASFHEILEQYAEHPMVPDEKDIEALKKLRKYLSKLKTNLGEYNAV